MSFKAWTKEKAINEKAFREEKRQRAEAERINFERIQNAYSGIERKKDHRYWEYVRHVLFLKSWHGGITPCHQS